MDHNCLSLCDFGQGQFWGMELIKVDQSHKYFSITGSCASVQCDSLPWSSWSLQSLLHRKIPALYCVTNNSSSSQAGRGLDKSGRWYRHQVKISTTIFSISSSELFIAQFSTLHWSMLKLNIALYVKYCSTLVNTAQHSSTLLNIA